MKRIVLSFSILGLVIGMSCVALAVPAPKVTICHATSSESNPWTRIVVSENAIGGHFDNPGTPKAGHEDDLLLQGEQDCPVPDNEDPEPPVNPTPDPVTPTPDPVKPSEPAIEAPVSNTTLK